MNEFQKIWMQFPHMTGIRLESVELLSGGDICKAARLHTSAGIFFIKWNRNENLLRSEQKNLDRLRETGIFRIPECYGCITFEGHTYLLMEFISNARPDMCTGGSLVSNSGLCIKSLMRHMGWNTIIILVHCSRITNGMQTGVISLFSRD